MTNKLNILDNYRRLGAEVDAIQKKLEKPLSSKACHQLFQKLEKTSDAFQSLKERTSKVAPFSSENVRVLDDKIQSLFGNIHMRAVTSKLSELQQKAQHLTTPKKIRSLKKDIIELTDQHALSRDHQKLLESIEISLQKVDILLTTKQEKIISFPTPSIEDISPDEVEEIMDLYELFDLYSSYKIKEATSKLNALSPRTRARFERLLQSAPAASPLDMTLQALIATANALAGNKKGYPSKREILSMQKDLLYIRKEEEADTESFEKTSPRASLTSAIM